MKHIDALRATLKEKNKLVNVIQQWFSNKIQTLRESLFQVNGAGMLKSRFEQAQKSVFGHFFLVWQKCVWPSSQRYGSGGSYDLLLNTVALQINENQIIKTNYQ